MKFCGNCHQLTQDTRCPICGGFVREVEDEDYCFLAEQPDIAAKLVEGRLKDANVPCVMRPVLGAGVAQRTGGREWYQLYVPYAALEQAQILLRDTVQE